jgi:hypothetical protein
MEVREGTGMAGVNSRVHRWRYVIVFGSTAFFDLVIPSLPFRRYHLFYWIAAAVILVLLLVALRPWNDQG